MEADENQIHSFANMLRSHDTKHSVTLYSENQSRNNIRVEYQIKDVLIDVSKQLKAIQNADGIKKYASGKGTSNLLKTNSFLPVNKLPVQQCSKPIQLNKFETQCVLDTQLVNIIKDAEALIDAEKDITQEFDTSFSHKDLDNSTDNIQEKECFVKSDCVYMTGTNTDKTNDNQDSCSPMKLSLTEEEAIDISLSKKTSRNCVPRISLDSKNAGFSESLCVSSQSNFSLNTFKDDNNIHRYLNEEDMNFLKTIVEQPKSPILNRIVPKIKSNTPSPLIFRLEAFEKFETIAMPVIKENHDIEIAKKVINSQIVNRELFIQTHAEPILSDRDKEASPILTIHENHHSENFETLSDDGKVNPVEEDCLLFSSDEENDLLKNSEELPLTCPIETPLCNETDILNKTMYVGFQTASNKPIQIQTDSYHKAKNFFDNVPTAHEKSILISSFDEDDNNAKYNSCKCDYIHKSNALIRTCGPKDNYFKTVKGNIENISNSKNQSPSDVTDLQSYGCDIPNKINLEEQKSNRSYTSKGTHTDTKIVSGSKEHLINDNQFNTSLIFDNRVQKLCEIHESNVGNILKNVTVSKIHLNSTFTIDDFGTTNDEITKTSEQALLMVENKKINNNFTQDIIIEDKIDWQGDNLLDSIGPTNKNFIGFSTANNKKIKVSEQALMKSKTIFENIDNNESFPCKVKNHKNKWWLNKSESKPDVLQSSAPDANKLPIVKKELNVNSSNQFRSVLENNNTDYSRVTCDKKFDGVRKKDDNTKKKNPYPVCNLAPSSSIQIFKTASNKPVVVSKKALADSKKIFQDIVIINDPTNHEDLKAEASTPAYNTVSSYKFQGFRTGNSEPVQISESALINAKGIFKDINIEDNEMVNDDMNVIKMCPASTSVFQGFKTANNAPVQISESALINAKGIFKDINIEDNEIVNDDMNVIKMCPASTSVFQGFKTANNAPVQISENALINAKGIFKDINIEENEIVNDDMNVIKMCPASTSVFQGFKTANNAPVQISESALINAKGIFKDINIEDNEIVNDDMNVIKMCPASTSVFQGFKTANNAPVQISESALINAKGIFNDINIEDNEIVNDDMNVIKMCPASTSVFQGFKTANNAPVQISESALINAKGIFKDINIEDNEIVNDDMNVIKMCPASTSVFQGFKTANNAPVQISENALINAKGIFKDINIEENEIVNDDMNVIKMCPASTSVFQGFKTAHNAPVQISESALINAKGIFKDINIEDNEIVNDDMNVIKMCPASTSVFQGFKTANNAPVQISESALINAKGIFNDINIEDNEIVNDDMNVIKMCPASTSVFQGFKTANNAPVQISESALINAKGIFKDIDIEENKTLQDGFNNLKLPYASDTAANSIVQTFITANSKPFNKSDNDLTNIKDIILHTDDAKMQTTLSMGAFSKAKNMLLDSAIDDHKGNEINNDLDFISKGKQSYPAFITKRNAVCKGFKTAGDKPVMISAEALAKSKILFQDMDIDCYDKQANDVEITETRFAPERSCNEKGKILENAEILLNKENVQNLEVDLKNNEFISPSRVHTHIIKSVIESNLLSKYGFKTANNTHVSVSEESLKSSRDLLSNFNEPMKTDDRNIVPDLNIGVANSGNQISEESFNTEVIKDFENVVYTEDFIKDVTPKSKRSGSPIFLCPTAKRRKKFDTPKSINRYIAPGNSTRTTESSHVYTFNENYKKIKKYSLRDMNESEKIGVLNDIDPYIFKFRFETLLNFEFVGVRNDFDSGSWTTDKITKYFTNSVNRKIIPEGWMENHLKLILWKLISYEVRFPGIMKNVCTVRNVLEQIKYRYGRELYNVERPALRKILERDEVSTRRMILCVASMIVDGLSVSSVTNQAQNIELLLSDGWYTIKASTDRMIDKLVCDGNIAVGTKLVIQGAELLNCEQGISPWEDTSSVRLKIFGNSTRRAKWDARLGFHGNGAMLTHLSAVKPEGGKVSQLRAYVTRVYPTLYIEKFPDGSTVTRSERLENIHQMKYETEQQIQLEKLYEEVEKFSDQESQDSEGQYPDDRTTIDSGSQIFRLMKRSRDHEEFRANLTKSQAYLLQQHMLKEKEKQHQKLQEKFQDLVKKRGLHVTRNVVPLMKIRVADVENGKTTKAMITIWKPNESLQEMVTEGTWIDLYYTVPTSFRYSEVQISAGRQSIFRKSKLKETTEKFKTYTETLKRQCYSIKDLQNPSLCTDYNEIDTVGLILSIEPQTKEFESTNNQFQNVYLTDADKNIICVNFWGGVKKFGFESILDTGQVVMCVNLQKRAGNTGRNIPQYRATEFSCITKTSKMYSITKMADELMAKICTLDKRKFIDDCIVLKDNFRNIKYGNIENVSPYRLNMSDYNVYKNKAFIDSPLVNKCTDVNLNLTGLDFESTFIQNETQELSPQALLRKKRVNEKIAKLKRYGEPPPLSSMHIINKSSNTIKAFKSPFTTNDVSPSVVSLTLNRKVQIADFTSSNASPQNGKDFKGGVTSSGDMNQNKVDHKASSPVIELNTTYYKRPSINPVKLNFSNFAEEKLSNDIDPFAEDFEGSLPLSLDVNFVK